MLAVWSHLRLFLIVWKVDRGRKKQYKMSNERCGFPFCFDRYTGAMHRSPLHFDRSETFSGVLISHSVKVKNWTASRLIVGVMTPFSRVCFLSPSAVQSQIGRNAWKRSSSLVTKSKSNMPSQRERHNKCVRRVQTKTTKKGPKVTHSYRRLKSVWLKLHSFIYACVWRSKKIRPMPRWNVE